MFKENKDLWSLWNQTQLGMENAWNDRVRGKLSRSMMGLSPMALNLSAADWAMHLAAAPGKQRELLRYGLHLQRMVASSTLKQEDSVKDESAGETDRRFRAPGWSQWPYRSIKEGFKASESWWDAAVQVDGVTRHNQHMVSFFARQWVDALCPANWPWCNPEVLTKANDTQGQSLRDCYQYLLKDLGQLAQQWVDTPPEALPPLEFEVGKDVAVTPGQVVFRNHLIELICYTPKTATVHPEPLLIVPSCIMKYYILDLSPKNSMVRYLLEQGHSVFIVSWRNPTAEDSKLTIADYLSSGVLAAMEAVQSRSGAQRIHAMGYCLGGTFLSIVAATLGRLARQKKRERSKLEKALIPAQLPELASVLLLAAQTDFTEPGELGVFIDEDQLATLRQRMQRKGYMSGRDMGSSFQFLSSREQVWSRSMRRYWLGEPEAGFDLMSWNADQTRLPAAMHTEYLSSMFLDNALARGQYHFAGTAVALMDIAVPMMVVATTKDHVAPWRSVYRIHLQTSAPVTFVLAAGGHNAGIVSEPGHPRRSYQISTETDDQVWTDPDEWAATTPVVQGSWWEAMHSWLKQHSGERVAPPVIKSEYVLADAPGDYVMVRYSD